jgi:hypothetical protein
LQSVWSKIALIFHTTGDALKNLSKSLIVLD